MFSWFLISENYLIKVNSFVILCLLMNNFVYKYHKAIKIYLIISLPFFFYLQVYFLLRIAVFTKHSYIFFYFVKRSTELSWGEIIFMHFMVYVKLLWTIFIISVLVHFIIPLFALMVDEKENICANGCVILLYCQNYQTTS